MVHDSTPGTPEPRGATPIDRAIERIAESPAALAALRRALGHPPGERPEAWPYTVPLTEGRGPAHEQAVHHALCLFAWHQQGQPRRMHQLGGPSLGNALAHLQRRRPDSPGVERRFLAAATADSAGELALHLRGLVTLLREEGIPLDYVRLVRDLDRWGRPGGAGWVRRRWGREFYGTQEAQETEPAIELPDETKKGD